MEGIVCSNSSVDLDSILGNHIDESLYEAEEKKYCQQIPTDAVDGRARRNAIVGTVIPVQADNESFFFTAIDSGSGLEISTEQGPQEQATSHTVVMPTWKPAPLSQVPSNDPPNLGFTEHSRLDVNSQILLKNVSYDDIVSGKLMDSSIVPGGLGMSHATTKKYFGVEARQHFYDQLQSMQRKREIYGTRSDFPTPADLSHSILMASPDKNKSLELAMETLPFKVDRPPKTLKVNTRVIIRNQGINLDDSYEQMKLIQKPKHLKIEDQYDSNSANSEEEDSDKEPARLPFPRPPILSIETSTPKKSCPPTPTGGANLRSPKAQKLKPSPSNLKLKPLVTGKSQSTSSLLSVSSGGGSGANSARSSESVRSARKKLSPMEKDDGDSDSRTYKLAKQKSSTKSSVSIENKPKQRQAHLQVIKEETDGNSAPSVALLADLYKEHLVVNKAQEEKVKSAKKTSKVEGEFTDNPKVGDMEFVCIDHRDPLNRKIMDNLHKKSSLFKYVEAKTAKRDFYDISDDSDHSDGEGEIQLWATSSPLSPAHVISALSPITNRNITRGTNVKNGKKLSIKPEDHPNKPTDYVELSPRSKFIDSCIRKKLNPRASLILRKTFTKELNLRHLGMGDDLAVLLADAIISIPYIQSLNICDNNLADKGLSAIVDAVCHMSDLVELDMSMNEIGPNAAFALNNYLSKDNCPLITLILRKADVDDDECRDFVQALEHNKNLKTLDLSENLVGSSENLNTVMPDLVTGGEALADLLSSPNCPLTTLKLGWNMIRLDGAAALCGALAVNQSLTYLELSFNSLGASGGVALGDALQDNKVLKTLLVANNSLDSIACLTICAGILENEALKEVSFDGNPIGEQGAKALMVSFGFSLIHSFFNISPIFLASSNYCRK